MKPAVRTVLSFLPLALQCLAMGAALGVISFIVPIAARVAKEAEGSVSIPAPSRLLIENSGAAKIAVVALFAVSVITVVVTRSKMKEEVDRVIVQSAVASIVWYAGITLLGGIVMAALLPHFALAAASP